MGFKITRDFEKDKDGKGAVGIESVKPKHFLQGVIGVDLNDQRYEYNGGKIKMRLLDDDGNIYYHALVDDDNFSCELLLDWGMNYAGATELHIHIDDYKKLYGEPRNKEFISDCGKWYSHMS